MLVPIGTNYRLHNIISSTNQLVVHVYNHESINAVLLLFAIISVSQIAIWVVYNIYIFVVFFVDR